MSSLLAIIPWVLFGIMVLFGLIFAVVAWRATSRANEADDKAHAAQMALAQVTTRAQHAEAHISEAQQRAALAEQKIAQAEEGAAQAREMARAAEARADQAERNARGALDRAQQADSALQQRRDAAEDHARKSEQRARSLLDWARQQWDARREPDRQRAQGKHDSFQAQLEDFLALRRAPVTFRVDSDVDRSSAPLMQRYATDQSVEIDGDLVKISFPVDAALGFRA